MKIGVLGMGSHGRTVALELASDPRVSELILVDKQLARARVLLRAPRMTSAIARELDDRRATDALASGDFTLDEARSLIYGDVRRFNAALLRAKEELMKVRGLARSYAGDPESFDIAKVVLDLATVIHEEMAARVAKPRAKAAA